MDMDKPWAKWMIDEYYGVDILDVLADEMQQSIPKPEKPVHVMELRKTLRLTKKCIGCGIDIETTSLARKYCHKCRISTRVQARKAKLTPVDNSVDK